MAPTNPRRRNSFRLARLFGVLAVALVILLPLGLLLLAVETKPRVTDAGPPDALAAERSRVVAARLKAVIDDNAPQAGFSISEDELNAVLAAGQRLAPGAVGRAHVDAGHATLDLSVGPPLVPRALWANLHLSVAPSDSGLVLDSASLGRLPVPPWLALEAIRIGLDRKLGDGLGSDLLASIAWVRLNLTPQDAKPAVAVAFDFDAAGGPEFFNRLRARVIEAAGSTARDRVYMLAWILDQRVRHGGLPRDGSILPWLKQALTAPSGPRNREADREGLRAALYTLALVCGDPDFGTSIAVGFNERMQSAASGCAGTTLAGRADLRKHFLVSAGLYAVDTGQAAFGMGELKELLDSNDGGSGFSFDDMAADLAGVRFARAFLAAPPERWPDMLARIATEADIMPSIDGLPSGLSDAEFRARFRDVDSPEYAAMVAEIERRIDALPLDQPRG
jgi:uncharacterized protein YfiM (DUF2279 family)